MEQTRGNFDEGGDLKRKFDEIFDAKLTKQIPHYKAYEEAEQEFIEIYKPTMYANYETYRKCRARRINNRKKAR